MTRRIAVFTGTRAEYGLLRWLMHEIQASEKLSLQVLVSGTHLVPEFGETWREIEADGFEIHARVEMVLASDEPSGIVKSMGVGLIGFADALQRLRPDAVVVLGDRFEALAIAQAAVVMGISVVHLHGGEVTEGAYDEYFRHAITKLASLHFTAADAYRRRVIQMGEDPERVFNVGAMGVDQLRRTPRLSRKVLSESLGIDPVRPFILATYHPATAANEDPATTAAAMLQALEALPYTLVLTYPNTDNGGRAIIALLQRFERRHPERVVLVRSLGAQRYASAMAYAEAVIGNSSSGIIEAPALGVPTVDIGMRQHGRLSADSVVHCGTSTEAIAQALTMVLDPTFKNSCAAVQNPYGDGRASESITRVLERWVPGAGKRFHDMEMPV